MYPFRILLDEWALIKKKSPDEMRNLAIGLEESPDHDDIERFICICILISHRLLDQEWLERARRKTENWIDGTFDGDPDRRRRLNILLFIIADEVQSYSNISRDLDGVSEKDFVDNISELGLEIATGSCEDKVASKYELVITFASHHSRLARECRDFSFLGHAIGFLERVATDPDDHHMSGACFRGLFHLLLARYVVTHSSEDADRAIGNGEMSMALATIYEEQGLEHESDDYLDRAIELNEIRISNHTFETSEPLFSCLDTTLRLLTLRQSRRSKVDDIERGLTICHQVLHSFPESPERFRHYLALAFWHWTRFQTNGLPSDSDLIFQAYQDAYDAYPQHEPIYGKVEIVERLLNHLVSGKKHLDYAKGCQRASKMIHTIIESSNFEQLSEKEIADLNVLRMKILSYQTRVSGKDEDIRKAIEIIKTFPPDHTNSLVVRAALMPILHQQFIRTGSRAYLDQGIDMGGEIMKSFHTMNKQEQVHILGNMGVLLTARSNRRAHQHEDILRAIELNEQALEIATAATEQNSISSEFRVQFENSIGHLHRALGTSYGSLSRVESGDRLGHLCSLAISHLKKSLKTGSEKLFDHGVSFLSLAMLHHFLANRTNDRQENLWLAHNYAEQSLQSISQENPFQVKILTRAGMVCHDLYIATTNDDLLERALAYFRESWKLRELDPIYGIRCGLEAGKILSKLGQKKKKEASAILNEAIDFLPRLSPRHLENEDNQYLLSMVPGLASWSAALTLDLQKAAEEATHYLERGRGVLEGLVMDMRADVSDLSGKNPTLANDFIRVRQMLDDTAEKSTMDRVMMPWDVYEISQQRSDLNRQFDEILQEIRSLDGFGRFMLPLGSAEMIEASNLGPIVIINVTSLRCDAILIDQRAQQSNRLPIRLLPLPDLKEDDIEINLDRMRQKGIDSATLEWLWDKTVCPILDDLGFTERPRHDDEWPHVWWILTGQLSQLPIHAAGHHGTDRTTLDRVISSYCPTIRSLWYGRQKNIRADSCLHSTGTVQSRCSSSRSALTSALFVAMDKTDGLSDLEFAAKEVDMLVAMCPDMNIQPVQPLATKKEVLDNIANCHIFHFAGHGSTDQNNPAKSCLMLQDWKDDPLTVADLRDSNLQQCSPFLGYLSACSTSVNQNDNLADESVHLVNALQLAGFRHVIGTLWQVSDSHCVTVAQIVYETIKNNGLTDESVRIGLHKAVRTLRDSLMPKKETRTVRYLAEKSTSGHSGEFTYEERDAQLVDLDDVASDSRNIQLWAAYIHVGA